MAEKKDFKTVEQGMNLKQIDTEIRRHRMKLVRRVAIGVIALFIIFLLLNLGLAMRSYGSYDIRTSVPRRGSEAAKFMTFQEKVVEYSNDGIRYWGIGGDLIWNQAFEMNTPTVDICGDYLVIFDKGGSEICIMTSKGLAKKFETSRPIKTACIAGQGTIAVLMEESGTSYVKLYDKQAKELANGQFYGSKGGYPVDIALSADARKLAIDMIDVNDGSIKSTISFYNFGSVGQNEIDNNVGYYSFPNVFIPQITYLSDSRMLAVGDTEYIVFDGKEKPAISKEVALEKNITSVFFNQKYIGTTTQNPDSEHPYHIHVYDMRGRTVMENDTTLQYESIEFLTNGEVCARTQEACELFTERGICKYSGVFDHPLYYVMNQRGQRDYVFVFEDATEEVRLK